MRMRTAADDQAISIRNVLIGFALLFGLTIWVWAVGKNFRAVYLGPGAGGFSEGVLVRTNPEIYAIVAPGDLAKMKVGCRYDFNHTPEFGKGRRDYSYRLVRAVTFVDCP
jgi:hypothetical protein